MPRKKTDLTLLICVTGKSTTFPEIPNPFIIKET